MAEQCPSPIEGCKYANTPECLLTKHHLYWPSPDYTTKIEKDFRNLEQNIQREVPRCEHDEIHATQDPPEKPSTDFMVGFLIASGVHIPRRLRKELKRSGQKKDL